MVLTCEAESLAWCLGDSCGKLDGGVCHRGILPQPLSCSPSTGRDSSTSTVSGSGNLSCQTRYTIRASIDDSYIGYLLGAIFGLQIDQI